MSRFYALVFLFLTATALSGQLLDDFEHPLDWQPHPSDGVTLNIVADPAGGHRLRAMRLDFDFHGHAGYAIARKSVSIDLPADYEFSFWIRAATPPNNLEFKLIDASGDNVWWVNQRNFVFPKEWTRLVLKKRHFQFAWGPLGGGEAHHIAAIEIVVTAGSGGKGNVWIDDLALTERHVVTLERAIKFNSAAVDFPEKREFGGLIVESDRRNYDVQISDDADNWQTIYSVRGAQSNRQYISTPDSEATHIRIDGARSITLQPTSW